MITHDHSFIRSRLFGVFPLLVLSLAACSKDEPRHYSTPKESATPSPMAPAPAVPQVRAMPGAMPGAMPQGLPPAEPPAAGEGLGWKLPEKWSQEAGSGMRFATIRTSDTPPVEISVVTLGGVAGGEPNNVNRWRAQLGLTPWDEATIGAKRLSIKSTAGSIGVFDLLGEGPEAPRMIAAILTVDDARTWFFKMTGDAKSLEAVKPSFVRLLETVHRD